MASDVALGLESSNPCCAEIRKRYQKLEEKRNALRQAVKLLEQQTDKLLNENANLKKDYEEQRVQVDLEKEAKEKEFSTRNMLEKELNELKARKSIIQETRSFERVDRAESRTCMLELETEIKRVKELLDEERKRSDSEKKKALEEKKRSAEAWRLVKVEKGKAEEERRLAEVERKIAEECRAYSEKVKSEANKLREQLVVEIRKAEDANKKVEAEKNKTNKEKKRANSERAKAEEQKRLMQIERKKAMEEKTRADNLLQKLNKERKQSEDLQSKIKDTLSTGRERISSCCRDGRCNSVTNIEGADVKLLREQLKRKKEQVKHARKISKLEKSKNILIGQELGRLKQDFLNISSRFSMLDYHLTDSIEGIDHSAKIKQPSEIWGYNLQNCLLPPKSVKEQGVRLTKTPCLRSFNTSHSMRECIDLQLSRGSCTRPTSGISSELEPPVGGSLGKKSQSSAACSYPTSFSDRTFMGSQGKDTSLATSATEIRKNSNWRSSIMKFKAPKTIQHQNTGVVGKEPDRKSLQENGRKSRLRSPTPDAVNLVDQVCNGNRKKRKIQDTLDSVAWMYCKDDELHSKIREKVSDLKNLLGINACLPAAKNRMMSNEGDFQVGNNGLLSEKSYKISSKTKPNRQTAELQHIGEPDNQNHGKKYSMDSNRVSCVSSGTATPLLAREDAVLTEGPSSVNSSDWAPFLLFQEMIQEDCMKLLDLDNDNEEKRYREAMEMPLSPTLPVIEFPSIQSDSHNMGDGLFNKFETEGNVFMAKVDVIDLEISSDKVKSKSPNSQGLCLDKNLGSTSKTNLNQNDVLNVVTEHYPSIDKSDSNLSVKQIYATNKCNYLADITSNAQSTAKPNDIVKDFKTFPNCRLNHNEILGSEAFDCARSVCFNEPLSSASTTTSFSQYMLHSEKLSQSLCSLNCPQDIGGDTSRTVSRPVIENNETLRCTEDAKNDFTEIQISGKQFLDCHISAQSTKENIQTGNSSHSIKTGDAKQIPLSTINTQGIQQGGYDEPEETVKCFVMFSNMNEGNLARIVHYVKRVISISENTVVTAELLQKIALETELLSEEKASISLSLLLYIIACTPTASSRFTMKGDFALSAGSFASGINRVIPNGENICLILDSGLSDILVCLIEDFLINKEVLIYNDRQYELSSCCPSDKFYLLDGSDMRLYSTAATTDQLVCGCVILASICARKDQIDIVLDTSYRILQRGRSDPSWTLLALHVFASVCGEKLLCTDNDSSSVTAIKLLVSLLENSHKSSCPLSSLNSATLSTEFSPCEQCPFAMDTVCMDNFICSLLDQLQVYCFSSVEHLDTNKSTAPLIYEISTSDGRMKHKSESVVHIDCHEGCNMYKYGKLNADQADCFAEKRLCYLTDVISLVELVGCYMSWEWTYNKVVVRLLEMLESCRFDVPSAALVVLVGQLGRFGVSDGGYHQSGVATTRGRLSLYIETNTSGKRSFAVQLSAVDSLLNLLPFTLKEIVEIKDGIPLDKSLFDQAIQIERWFAQLSREQKTLSCSLYT